MEADRIKAIRASAIYKATQKGYPLEWAEDFAQEACERIFHGRKATVSQLLIDYVRETQGATRHAENKRIKLELHADGFDDEVLSDPGITGTEPDLLNYLNLLEGDDRAIMALKFAWDMTEPEIGAVFGVSGSRISQKVKEITARLRKRLNNLERGTS
jgi:DNA-directed RNA polymerase specialized sigma subunit